MLSYPKGSKLKKSSGYLLATNWRNIVNRCKFLVASLCIVNDVTYSMARSIRFDCLKILRAEVSINLEVNCLCLYVIWQHFYDKSKGK